MCWVKTWAMQVILMVSFILPNQVIWVNSETWWMNNSCTDSSISQVSHKYCYDLLISLKIHFGLVAGLGNVPVMEELTSFILLCSTDLKWILYELIWTAYCWIVLHFVCSYFSVVLLLFIYTHTLWDSYTVARVFIYLFIQTKIIHTV